MSVSKFIDIIRQLLKLNYTYYETENEFCFDCRINKSHKFDQKLLDELKILGVLITDKNRYTKVLKRRTQTQTRKSYRWFVINKSKFESLERLILLGGVDENGKNV